MTTLIVHPDNKQQLSAIKAFMKALKISFEENKESSTPYNAKFTEKILQGVEDKKQGKGKKIKVDDLWNCILTKGSLQ